jgi:prepilin-type N-terminal cleavage/methylation domain-containing protein
MGTVRKMTSRSHGFTLIEMLVAVAILGLVVGIGSYGYSLFTRNWSSGTRQFEQAAAQFQRLDLAVRAVSNTLPYVVRDNAGQLGFYFLGRDEGLTLVSASPVFAIGDIAVIRLFREPGTPGRWNLVYEEAPLAGVHLRAATQTLPFSHRMVVLRDLARIEFAYHGWESIEARAFAAENGGAASGARWYPAYDGLLRHLHPDEIAFKFDSMEAVMLVPARGDTSMQRYAEPL